MAVYRLIITKKNGEKNKYIYKDYETLEYNATMCIFSQNITKVVGQKQILYGWKTLFIKNFPSLTRKLY